MKNKIEILLVEDQETIAAQFKLILEKKGAKVYHAKNQQDAFALIDHKHTINYVLLDHNLENNEDGFPVFFYCLEKGLTNISLLSSEDDEQVAKKYFKGGLKSFFIKENFFDRIDEIYQQIKNTINSDIIQQQISNSLGTSNEELLLQIKNLTIKNFKNSILLTGPTGSGKGHVATLLHKLSSRQGSFVELDCNQFENESFVSELFGHERGAYTGAISSKDGKILQADNGTLFIDEIGKSSISNQKKLLKFLDTGSFTKWGSSKILSPNVRLIFGSTENLEDLVSRGLFLKDLYFRIKHNTIKLPELQDRKQDIPLLVNKFLRSLKEKKIISDHAKAMIYDYNWPGNIRELKKVIESFDNFNSGYIDVNHLPLEIQNLKNKTESKILTKEQIRLAEKVGYETFLSKVEDCLLQHFYELSTIDGKLNNLLMFRNMQISRAKGRTLLKKTKGGNCENRTRN
jgi:DNA-binding NtrC family response regulator